MNELIKYQKLAELLKQNRAFSDHFSIYEEEFVEGFHAFFKGLKEDDNPYKESGHERDTTYQDYCHQEWYSGYWAAYKIKDL